MKNARLFTRGTSVFICLLPIIMNMIFVERSVAQAPVANFSSNVTTGCSPLIVQFTDQSTGSPTSWSWDLGNGSTSSVENPTSTYVTPGTYTITLTVTNASGSSTKTGTVTVAENAIAKFTSTDTSGCTPHTVTFTDQSTTASGTITQWEWNFGDGAISTTQHPTHIYNTAGTYNVFLKVTTSAGCSQTIFKQQYIKAGSGGQANFVANVAANCQVPVTVSFANNSQVDASATYLWDFGDGNTSTTRNTSHTYNTAGSFVVTLTIQNPDGCNSIKQQTLNIGGRDVSFTGPSTICTGSASNFQMTSSPAPVSQTWNMGDGATYSDASITHTYTAAGTYTITLTNDFGGGCVASKTQTVNVIAGPSLDFKADTTKACKPPFAVNFQPIGNATNYTWTFGDGNTSNQSNPSYVYQTSGSFDVTLTATSTSGCVSTIQKPAYIQILPPSISIANLPVTDGCTPYSFTPAASINATEGVASYFWDFGNGATSQSDYPTYTYNVPGSYTVKLKVQTNGGCVDSVVYQNAVNVSAGTQFDFTAVPTIACVGQPVTFTMNNAVTPTTYEWIFGDGETSTDASPTHAYENADKYDVTLKISYGTCVSKLTKLQYIDVQPPQAKFSAVGDCNNRRLINFTNESIGTGSMLWNFGDGATSTAINPSHLYASDGSYTVSLTINNGTCTHTFTEAINISSILIDFTTSANVVCKSDQFTLTALVPSTLVVSEYLWTIPNANVLSTSADTIPWVLSAAGTYDVTLKITTVNGCEETITKANYITAYGPTADFISDKLGGCENSTINFDDSSATDGIHSITQWQWNFGDASPAANGTSVSHTYADVGSYDITLKVTDNYGCSDTRVKPAFINISNGKAMFTAMDSMSCRGKEVLFTDTSTGNIASWEWNFGDGTAVTGVQHPSHMYNDSGYYSVKLKIIETSGCADSITKTNYITIKDPVAKFGLSDTFSTCPPLTVSFYDSSYYVKSWLWNFADGGGSPVASPTNLYTLPGTYDVKLTVTSPGGCTDTASARIRILGPYGAFTYTPLTGCSPLNVNYNVSSSQAVKFLWDYSDGVVDSGTVATSNHTYISGGKFVPKVILTDLSGCQVPVVGNDTIFIEKTLVDFSASQVSFCDSGTAIFTNESVINTPGISYEWNIDGNTISTEDVNYTFNDPGSYDVTLISTTLLGCKDTLVKPAFIRVHRSPVAAIVSEDSLCISSAFNFSVQLEPDTSGINSWNWNFGNGQQSNLQTPPSQLFGTEGTFSNTLSIEDSDGCTTVISKSVVVHPLPFVQASQDEIICRGNSIQLSASGAVTYNWLAPNADLSCVDCPDPIASPLQDVMYKVEGASGYGCTAYDSVTIKVFQPYSISVQSANDSLCEGRSIQLKVLGAPMYSWSPATALSAINISNPTANPTTSITYKVVGYDSLNCFRDSAEVAITVLSSPTVDAGADLVVSAGSTANIQCIGSTDVITYSWSPPNNLSCIDCGNPTVTGSGNTTYTVKVANSIGCTAQDDIQVLVTCNEANIFIPNTFTPNGDGMNDVFFVRGKGVFEIKSLRVFNRWGEMLYEKKDMAANNEAHGWNGTYKGVVVNTDTYVYQVEVVCTNNEVLKYNGTISLIR